MATSRHGIKFLGSITKSAYKSNLRLYNTTGKLDGSLNKKLHRAKSILFKPKSPRKLNFTQNKKLNDEDGIYKLKTVNSKQKRNKIQKEDDDKLFGDLTKYGKAFMRSIVKKLEKLVAKEVESKTQANILQNTKLSPLLQSCLKIFSNKESTETKIKSIVTRRVKTAPASARRRPSPASQLQAYSKSTASIVSTPANALNRAYNSFAGNRKIDRAQNQIVRPTHQTKTKSDAMNPIHEQTSLSKNNRLMLHTANLSRPTIEIMKSNTNARTPTKSYSSRNGKVHYKHMGETSAVSSVKSRFKTKNNSQTFGTAKLDPLTGGTMSRSNLLKTTSSKETQTPGSERRSQPEVGGSSGETPQGDMLDRRSSNAYLDALVNSVSCSKQMLFNLKELTRIRRKGKPIVSRWKEQKTFKSVGNRVPIKKKKEKEGKVKDTEKTASKPKGMKSLKTNKLKNKKLKMKMKEATTEDSKVKSQPEKRYKPIVRTTNTKYNNVLQPNSIMTVKNPNFFSERNQSSVGHSSAATNSANALLKGQLGNTSASKDVKTTKKHKSAGSVKNKRGKSTEPKKRKVSLQSKLKSASKDKDKSDLIKGKCESLQSKSLTGVKQKVSEQSSLESSTSHESVIRQKKEERTSRPQYHKEHAGKKRSTSEINGLKPTMKKRSASKIKTGIQKNDYFSTKLSSDKDLKNKSYNSQKNKENDSPQRSVIKKGNNFSSKSKQKTNIKKTLEDKTRKTENKTISSNSKGKVKPNYVPPSPYEQRLAPSVEKKIRNRYKAKTKASVPTWLTPQEPKSKPSTLNLDKWGNDLKQDILIGEVRNSTSKVNYFNWQKKIKLKPFTDNQTSVIKKTKKEPTYVKYFKNRFKAHPIEDTGEKGKPGWD